MFQILNSTALQPSLLVFIDFLHEIYYISFLTRVSVQFYFQFQRNSKILRYCYIINFCKSNYKKKVFLLQYRIIF